MKLVRDIRKDKAKKYLREYEEAEDDMENFHMNSQAKLKKRLRRDKESFKHYLRGSIF